MVYFTAKSNLAFARGFKQDVKELWRIEDIAALTAQYGYSHSIPSERQKAIQKAAGDVEGYEEVREKVAQGLVKMIRLGHSLRVALDVTSMPPPAVGGAIVHQNILRAILSDSTHGGIGRLMIVDSINQILGQLKEAEEGEWRQLVNPFFWVKKVFLFVLRIPVELIKLAGFNVDRFEEAFWGKSFLLLWIIALIGFLIWLGFTIADIGEIIKNLVGKTT